MEKIIQPTIKKISGTRLTAMSGLFVCFGIVLPFITSHAYGLKGNVFLPMHIPIILCGFFCGARRGFLCGIITPVLSSILTDMPVLYPMLPIMTLELSMYGFVSGFLYSKGNGAVASLTLAMLVGRICYAAMFYLLLLADPSLKLGANPIVASMPVLSALMLGVPGIIIQLILIPTITSRLSSRLSKH